MNVRVIVPRRADDGHRDRLWQHCAPQWARPVVEGHSVDGPFNRSAAINSAARGDWDVAVIADADVLIDQQLVADAVDRAAATGRAVLPFTERRLLTPMATRLILRGLAEPTDAGSVRDPNRDHASSCVVVPRALWEAVHGFDERFVGWGAEDDAFHAACVARVGVDRLRGTVWHLHHPPSPEKHFGTTLYRMSKALCGRYLTDPTVIDEDRAADQIAVVCLTNGRRDTLAKTIHSADEMLAGAIGRKVIIADRCTPAFDGWATVNIRGGTYTRAMAAAVDVAVASGQPWIFWLEDDFTIDRPVDLDELRRAMEPEPELAQMSLLRQPWYDEEKKAGGLIAERISRGDHFVQRDRWVEHWAYWTQNPMLTRRSFLAEHPWPKQPGSENRYGRQLFEGNASACAGIWGQIDDPPICTHIGIHRAGTGY